MVQDQGGVKFQPAGILKYFEDLKRRPNAEIGPKDFFEIASIKEVESMAQLRKKELYEITVDNLAPPYEDYEFFEDKITPCFVASNNHFAIVAFRGSETRLREGDSNPG